MGHYASSSDSVTTTPSAAIIPSKIGETIELTEVLNSAVAALESRVEPVLGPSTPKQAGTKEGVPSTGTGVPLANQIVNINERLRLVIVRLNSIIDRVEV